MHKLNKTPDKTFALTIYTAILLNVPQNIIHKLIFQKVESQSHN